MLHRMRYSKKACPENSKMLTWGFKDWSEPAPNFSNFEYCATTAFEIRLEIALVGESVHIYEPPEHVFDVNNQVDCGALAFGGDLASKCQECQECQGFSPQNVCDGYVRRVRITSVRRATSAVCTLRKKNLCYD